MIGILWWTCGALVLGVEGLYRVYAGDWELAVFSALGATGFVVGGVQCMQ